jgi:hypothetical protein
MATRSSLSSSSSSSVHDRGPPGSLPLPSSSSSSFPNGRETKGEGRAGLSSSTLASSSLSPDYKFSKDDLPRYTILFEEKIVPLPHERNRARVIAFRTLKAWCEKKNKVIDDLFEPRETGFWVSHSILHPTRIVVKYADGLESLNHRLAQVHLRAEPILPERQTGVIGPIRRSNSSLLLDILREACPSVVLTQRYDLIYSSPTSTEPPYKLMKDSYDFGIHRTEFASMTSTVCKPPFATNIIINVRQTHKGKKIYCSKCIGTDHFHTTKRPCTRPIACPNCLSTGHKFVNCTEVKVCRECKSPDHQVLTCPKVKRQLIKYDLHRVPSARRPSTDNLAHYPPLSTRSHGSSSSSSSSSLSASNGRGTRNSWQTPPSSWKRTSPIALPQLPSSLFERDPTSLIQWVQNQMTAIDAIHDQLATIRSSYSQFLDLISESATKSTAPRQQPPPPPAARASRSRPRSRSVATPPGPESRPSPSSTPNRLPVPSLALLSSPSSPPQPSSSPSPVSSPSSLSSSPNKRPAPLSSSDLSSSISDDDMQTVEDREPADAPDVTAKKPRTASERDGKEGKGDRKRTEPIPSTTKVSGRALSLARPKKPPPSPSSPPQPSIKAILAKGVVRASQSLTSNGDSSTESATLTHTQ